MRNVGLIVISCVVMMLLAWYLYHYLLRIVVLLKGELKSKKIQLVVLLVAILLILCAARFVAYGMMILAHILVIAGITEILNVLIKRIYRGKTEPVHWKRLYASGLIPIVVTTMLLTYGYINMHHVVETDYEVQTGKTITQNGYEIAMISDLHYPISMGAKDLTRYCQEISSKKPDLIVLCGDIIDERTTKEEMVEALTILGTMQSVYGTYYVYGNHDEARYSTDPLFMPGELSNTLTTNGIHILKDEVVSINDEFTIIGRADVGYGNSSNRKDQEELLKQVDMNDFILLLDHQPKELKENARHGIDLQLSGHTHGGQFWPAGIIGEWLGANEQNYGLRKNGEFVSIVSSGIAGWGNPFKTAKRSEYVFIHVTPK